MARKIFVKGFAVNLRQGFWPCVLLALLSFSPSEAQPIAKNPLFSVRLADGSELRGAWRQLRPDWSIRLGEGEGNLLSGKDVLTVRRLDVPLPPLPAVDHFLLANGDHVPFQGKGLRLAEEKLHFRHPNLEDGKETALPLSAVSLLWRTAPDKTLDEQKLRRRLAIETRTRDTVCLRNGDMLSGMLSALDEQMVEMEIDKKRVTVKMPQVAYIAFSSELADTLRPKGVFARLVLTDTRPGCGGRLSLTKAACEDGEALSGVTVFGARLRVPLSEVAALDLHQGRGVYLSDLKPSKYEFHPYLDAAWNYAADGNVAEHDLLLGGSTFDKGISLHSHGRLTFRLSGGYRRFEALVGLDDKDGRHGSVRIRVWADGVPLDLGDRELTAAGGPLALGANIEGVRELSLEVEFGKGGDVQDVVDWVDARVIK